MSIPLSFQTPELVRAIAGDPRFTPNELFTAPADGHLFAPGERATLTGLESFPEFNGTEVEITAIRESGEYGRAYYFKGAANSLLNWTYENRLAKINPAP